MFKKNFIIRNWIYYVYQNLNLIQFHFIWCNVILCAVILFKNKLKIPKKKKK